MRRLAPRPVTLSRAERRELDDLADDGHTDQRFARRARILLAVSDPETMVSVLATQVDCTPTGVWYACRRFEGSGLEAVYNGERSWRPRELTAMEPVQIEQSASCDLLGLSLELTHWSTRSLATITRERLHRPHLGHSTVSLILREADLQAHRSRYWKTPALNAELASRVLWCYEQMERLYQPEAVILSPDEKPNLQATERTRPTQRMRAGQTERQGFEYLQHGTVNLVVEMTVNDGKIHGWCLDANDSEHLCPILAELFVLPTGPALAPDLE